VRNVCGRFNTILSSHVSSLPFRGGDGMLMVDVERAADLLSGNPVTLIPGEDRYARRGFELFTCGRPPVIVFNDDRLSSPRPKVLHERPAELAVRGEVCRL